MISNLRLENFKCFEKMAIPLSHLTLLTGVNSSGKSTVLQSLALLSQTSKSAWSSRSLILNDSDVNLGSAMDVIDSHSTSKDEFKIGVGGQQWDIDWTFKIDTRAAQSVPIKQVSWKGYSDTDSKTLRIAAKKRIDHLIPQEILAKSKYANAFSNQLRRLTYLSADRLGPRETYSTGTRGIDTTVGSRGERTVWYLYEFDDSKPISGLLKPGHPLTLIRQVEAWLQDFFPGVELNVSKVTSTNLVTVGMRSNEADNFHRPQNVGYGISYLLPIITACLGGRRDNIISIENPEAHLHPRGQAEIGMFLSRCAALGIQIVLETHSDHVLNGVRKSVKRGIIKPDDVSIHFFNGRPQSSDDPEQVESLYIGSDGNLDYWPKGFFDQFDQDLSSLLGWD